MKHKESDLQIRCIKWFRYQYPAFALLMEHPKNEGNGNRRQGAIAKAEGVQPGVADLILHVPAIYHAHAGSDTPSSVEALYQISSVAALYQSDEQPFHHSLAIEMKTKNGRQSPQQRQWQRLFEAAGGRYAVVRSYEEFTTIVTEYIDNVPPYVSLRLRQAYDNIRTEADQKAKEQLRKILNK